MSLSSQSRLPKFLLLSLLIHLIIGQLGWQFFKNSKKTITPIHIKFIEQPKEKNEELIFKKGKILDVSHKPKIIEKPKTKNILSRHNSKAHGNRSAIKRKQYKSSKTIIPAGKSKPKPTINNKKKKAVQEEKTTGGKIKIAKSELQKESKKNVIISKKTVEKKELNKPDETLKILKGLMKQQDNTKKEDDEKKQPSIFEGFNSEKFAKIDTGDEKDESDIETVSLDSQEFKYVSYFGKIKRQIERVWFYPDQAATRGLQGELLLKFTLSKRGKLVDISLINSSGFKVLDDAALDAVKIAAPYNPFPSTIQKKNLRIIASFVYKPSYTLYQ